MFEKVLSGQTLQDLEALARLGLFSSFYLAGGTGCSLQIGHRISFDLDLFSREKFKTKNLIERLRACGQFLLEVKEPDTLIGIFEKTRISLFRYPYQLLFPAKEFRRLSVADIRDIACMKLDAISSRGSRRDFVDLYFIIKEIGNLKIVIDFFKKKYEGIEYNIMHILKSLVYFEDAEKEPMPIMIKNVNWIDIKKFFEENVRSHINEGRE